MERKTAEEILKEVYEAYPKEGDWQPFEEAKESIEISTQAMQKYADQEKEAEAVAVLDWYRDNKVKIHILNGMQPISSIDIYKQFKQQTGGK